MSYLTLSDFNNILASDDPQLSIHSMGDSTFTLSDGLVSHTPLILLQNQVLLWDAPPLGRDPATGQETVVVPTGQGWEAWTDDVWRLFEVVQPRPGKQIQAFLFSVLMNMLVEILIFGTGKTVLPPPPHIKTYLNSLGIQVEAHNTVSGPGCAHSMSDFEKRNACSTYNLLAEEERLVAAALLPNVRKPTQRIRSNEKAQESARPG